jgi:glycosyltransferase involved in cell wall biosynthesis
MPIFSIVIPCFNSEAYIHDTLQSLAAQTFQDFEILVIDDGSTDHSVPIAKRFLDKYHLPGVVVERPETAPKGVANCRNIGIQMAKGDWICFLDSDDLFLPEKLQITFEQIRMHGDQCAAYTHGVRRFEDATGKTLSEMIVKSNPEPEDIFPNLLTVNQVTTSATTIKKTLLQELGGFDITLHGIEDYMMWLRVAKRTKWQYTPLLLTEYRIRTQSLMGGRELSYYVTQNTNLMRAVKKTGEFSEDEIQAIDHHMFDSVMYYYAMVSLNHRGWPDFMKGLSALVWRGRLKLALRLFWKHLKQRGLKTGHDMLKKKRRD